MICEPGRPVMFGPLLVDRLAEPTRRPHMGILEIEASPLERSEERFELSAPAVEGKARAGSSVVINTK